MNNKRKAPYNHADGSNCWTKNCSRGNEATSPETKTSSIQTAVADAFLSTDTLTRERKLQSVISEKLDQVFNKTSNEDGDDSTKEAIAKIMREHDKAVSEANLFGEGIEYSETNPISARKIASEYFGAQGYSTNGDSVVYLSMPNGDKAFIEMDSRLGNRFRTDVGLYSNGGKYYVKLTKSYTTIKNGTQLKIYVDEALEEARYAMQAYESDGNDASGMYSEYDRAGL